MKEEKKEKIKNYLLENIETLKDITREINGYSGALDYLDYWNNDEEFFDIFFNNPMEAVRACYYGDYNYCDEYVSINAYGNLTSCSEWDLQDELKSNIDEITEELIDNIDNIYIYDEKLKELIEEDEEDEEESEGGNDEN